MSRPAIRVEGLWKQYLIGEHERNGESFREALTRSLVAPLRWIGAAQNGSRQARPFWALQDVSLTVEPGQIVGVIGRNGAGKTTLLKVLSKITAPTRGRVEVLGRLGSLLEVGTGFHPELTGRENIYINGSILGMRRADIRRRFDQIVAFAEVEQFLDTPVKRYSSGMSVRLAFAIAAHLETDVLLVDEVLAVGDAAFQRKSLGKMSEAAVGGRTVLFVSHNLGAIRNLCQRALIFESGKLALDGDVREGLAHYERSIVSGGDLANMASFQGPLAGDIQLDRFVCRQGGETVTVLDPLCACEIQLHGTALREFPTCDLMIAVYRDGFHIGSCHDASNATVLRKGPFMCVFRFPADIFRPGRYVIGIGAAAGFGAWAWASDVVALEFANNLGGRSAARSGGVISIPFDGRRVQW
jgi:lipopolysaccharide transport system ATP-binding protein